MQFLRRELVGGLSVLIGLAAFFGGKFKFTPVVIGLLAFGALWTLVVVGWAVYEKLPWELRRKGASDLPDWLERLLTTSTRRMIGDGALTT